MSWIEDSLSRLESSLRAVIEGDATRDGVGRKFHNHLAHALSLAMQARMQKVKQEGEAGSFVYTAPDQYILVMPAEQAKLLLTHPAELDRLANNLRRSAEQAHIQMATAPILRVVASPNAEEVSVLAEWSHAGTGDSGTTELEDVVAAVKVPGNGNIPGAFLIVNGLNTYTIADAVTNIGSETGNHLILHDPGVGRVHAQLRLINNRHTIFDLDGRGRTLVNGVAVANQALDPGDVIQLGGVLLVYGQESSSPADGYTQQIEPARQRPEVL